MGNISTVVQQSTRPKVQYALKFALKLDTYESTLLAFVRVVLAIFEMEACWQPILDRTSKEKDPTASTTECFGGMSVSRAFGSRSCLAVRTKFSAGVVG